MQVTFSFHISDLWAIIILPIAVSPMLYPIYVLTKDIDKEQNITRVKKGKSPLPERPWWKIMLNPYPKSQ